MRAPSGKNGHSGIFAGGWKIETGILVRKPMSLLHLTAKTLKIEIRTKGRLSLFLYFR